MNTAKNTANTGNGNGNGKARENYKALYNESLVQLTENTEKAYEALLTLCVATARLACFENDADALKSVWTLPTSCKAWQGKARLLLCYLVGNGTPTTAKNGKVTYTVHRDNIKIDKDGNIFLPEGAKDIYRRVIKDNGLKGLRTAEKAISLLSALRWQKEEKAVETLTAGKVADMLAGLQNIAETDKALVETAIRILRGE